MQVQRVLPAHSGWAELRCAALHHALPCAGSPGFDPSTLFIPPAALSAMSEFGRQFWVRLSERIKQGLLPYRSWLT